LKEFFDGGPILNKMGTSDGRWSLSKRRQIEEFFKQPNSVLYTRTQVAKQFNVSEVYVTRIAGRMGLTRTYRQHQPTKVDPNVRIDLSPPESPGTNIPEGAESLRSITSEAQVQEIVRNKTLSTDQQRQSLS